MIRHSEIVASDVRGAPDFVRLRCRGAEPHELCVWTFDLLEHDGFDVRGAQARPSGQLFSQCFTDPIKLLAEWEELQGIVLKRVEPYRSGDRADWIKVKRASWREANKDRHELAQRR
jgi:ATP-dependent DNA ligase